MNTRSRTSPSGARPGYFTLENVQAIAVARPPPAGPRSRSRRGDVRIAARGIGEGHDGRGRIRRTPASCPPRPGSAARTSVATCGAVPASTTPSAASLPAIRQRDVPPRWAPARRRSRGVPTRAAPGGGGAARARARSSIPSARVTKRLQRVPLAPVASSGRAARRIPRIKLRWSALERQEPRHRRRQRQAIRIRRVDPSDQGLGHALERLAPEPPPDEAPEALVAVRPPARQDQIHPEPELPRSRRRGATGATGPTRVGAGGRNPSGKGVQPASQHTTYVRRKRSSVRRSRGPRPRRSAKQSAQGFSEMKESRPGLEQEPVGPLGPDDSAQPTGRLEEDEVERPRRRPAPARRADARPPARQSPPPTTTTRSGVTPPSRRPARGGAPGRSGTRGHRRPIRLDVAAGPGIGRSSGLVSEALDRALEVRLDVRRAHLPPRGAWRRTGRRTTPAVSLCVRGALDLDHEPPGVRRTVRRVRRERRDEQHLPFPDDAVPAAPCSRYSSVMSPLSM